MAAVANPWSLDSGLGSFPAYPLSAPGTVTPAFDQPCTSALPLQTVCRLLKGLGISCTLRDLANLP